jgi:hypothetical protein
MNISTNADSAKLNMAPRADSVPTKTNPDPIRTNPNPGKTATPSNPVKQGQPKAVMKRL